MLSFTHLLVAHFSIRTDAPEIHFSFGYVSKASDDKSVRKWRESNHVPESLAIFEVRLCLFTEVESRLCRLLARNNDKVFAIGSPVDVLNLLVEGSKILASFALVDTYKLERVLSVVGLSSCVIEVLRPHENCVATGCGNDLDGAGSRTRNIELGPLQVRVQIIDVNQAVILRSRHNLAVLPGH